MKKFMLSAVIFMSIATLGMAQEKGKRTARSAEKMAQRQTERISEQLGLTAEQQKDVYAINLDRSKKIETIRKERAGKMTAMRDEQKAGKEKLMSILTPEQKQAYEKVQAERKERVITSRKQRGNVYQPNKNNLVKRPVKKDSTSTATPVSK